jgi:cytochrome c-type biogenesis protein CcsB
MKKFTTILFSMQTMGTLILLFAFSIGTATFIENDFGSAASKAVVYNATWFNLLLLLLTINLVGRIITDRMYQLKKATIFLFHFAFIVIIIGAAITRFISYEGVMHIREGDQSNSIISDKTHVDIVAMDGNESITSEKSVMISVLTQGAYSDALSLAGKKFKFNSVKYIPNAREVITESNGVGDPYIILVYSDDRGRMNQSLKYGDNKPVGVKYINFSESFDPDAINIRLTDGNLEIFASEEIVTLSMTTSLSDTLDINIWHPFESRKLFSIGNSRIVLTDYYPSGKVDYVPYTGTGSMMDAMVVEIESGSNSKEIILRGGKGYEGEKNYFEFEGVNFSMTYGAKEIILPFSLKLVDFQLERYPGSNSPSSYASEVVLIDKAKNESFNYRIFMNNVLNYGGFRFFQSSYDKDEQGTILSVAHDSLGTFFTYLGYFLMSLGMLLTIFNRNTRFALLGRLVRKVNGSNSIAKSLVILFALSITSGVYGQITHTPISALPEISKEQAKEFGKLITQSQDGRFKPVNTLSGEILRKISRKSELEGLSSDQVMLGMMTYPLEWQQVRMIKVSHPEVKDLLEIDGKHASYLDFINLNDGTYKLSKFVSNAYEKKPARRNKFDNEILKVDERLNICYMVFKGDLLRIFPVPYDIDESWYSPVSELKGVSQEDSAFISTIIPAYLNSISTNDSKQASQLLQGISDYQEKFSGSILPSSGKIKYELMYNKMQIFDNLSKLYGLLGVLLLILLFVEMFKPSKGLKYVINFFISLVVVGFIVQTLGLALRWYISGHAPWSDGYETMIYISWVIIFAGLIFAYGSKMTIAATTFLSSIILMVAHLSWMDPEVTNLVPVLKSYWLTIHVSVITASYGFMALSSLLGLINLLMMIFKNSGNAIKMNLKINELTAISERSVMIGLYMLTIGTFLGGVWANESWGRYWGWDPKETWALVSVLVYSFIAHMHYMPGLKGKFSFNFATLIAYGVILMTYFGVNYYLSGLHSYAKGDPVPVPNFVYYSIVTIAIISVWAYIRDKKFAIPIEKETTS